MSLIEEATRGSRTITNIYTVNKSFRCCPVERHSRITGVLDTVFKSEYEQHDGIYVPKYVLMSLQDGSSKSIITFKKNIINADIPDDVFSLKGLGARRGDAVYDERTDANYFLDDEQYPFPDYANGAGRTGIKYLRYALGSVGLLLILTFLVIRYYKWHYKRGV